MKDSRRALAVLAAALSLCFMACTCDFEFAFDGKVMDADDGSPIEGATVATARYDLYALDSDEYNTIERADYRLTDSSGAYRVICSGLYDCAQGRIEDPGDLGVVYLYVFKEGYLQVERSIPGDMVNTMHTKHNWYDLPDVYLRRIQDSGDTL